MSLEVECRKCGEDLEQWNSGRDLWVKYCPHCGTRLLKKQSEALHRKTTVDEISDMIRGHLLDMLSGKEGMDVSADELADLAWQKEYYCGVVFYSNYRADQFMARHMDWADGVFGYVEGRCEDTERYVKVRAEGCDRFLVAAFVCATEHYVFEQLGIEPDEGDLTKTRIKEIKRLIRTTDYDGSWA